LTGLGRGRGLSIIGDIADGRWTEIGDRAFKQGETIDTIYVTIHVKQ
jgi:hypothetical protein